MTDKEKNEAKERIEKKINDVMIPLLKKQKCGSAKFAFIDEYNNIHPMHIRFEKIRDNYILVLADFKSFNSYIERRNVSEKRASAILESIEAIGPYIYLSLEFHFLFITDVAFTEYLFEHLEF